LKLYRGKFGFAVVEITGSIMSPGIYMVEGRLPGQADIHPVRTAGIKTAATIHMGPELLIVR
jgi:hypothetical protein